MKCSAIRSACQIFREAGSQVWFISMDDNAARIYFWLDFQTCDGTLTVLDIKNAVNHWLAQGKQVGLATVVSTWGSSPRQAGARMAFLDDLTMVGSVSGGCVESAVLDAGLRSLNEHQPHLLHFGVADEQAWEVGVACGGQIAVYIEPLDMEWWCVVADRLSADRPFAAVTVITGAAAGHKLLLDETGVLYQSASVPIGVQHKLAQVGNEGLARQASYQVESEDGGIFVDVYQPRPRLIIVGGAHAAVALAQMAVMVGFRVFLVDPRRAFATPARFPQVECISHEYPDKALPKIGLTPETYVAILTHDPKIDDPALQVALGSPAPYVGVLSSRRVHEQRLERLRAAGMSMTLLQQIHTPIGLNIGAQSPEEIALCIMAEIVAVRRGRLDLFKPIGELV